MSRRVAVAAAVVLVLAAAGWFRHGSAPLADAAPDAATTFKAAGVHKCVGARGTSYGDGACPAGTREAAASGGAVTVTSFPRPAPLPESLASGVPGGPLVKPMDPDERDRLRDKAIEDAANRR